MTNPDTSSSPALPRGEGREPSEQLERVLTLIETIQPGWERTTVPVDDLRLLAAEIRRLRFVASRDTRDAGAVAPVAWMVQDHWGHSHGVYDDEMVAAASAQKNAAWDDDNVYGPFTVIPLVPAPPRRAGTDGADQERR